MSRCRLLLWLCVFLLPIKIHVEFSYNIFVHDLFVGLLWHSSLYWRSLQIYLFHGKHRTCLTVSVRMWLINCLLINLSPCGKFSEFLWRVPMYGEMKLVLFVYMWYPKTRVSHIFTLTCFFGYNLNMFF